ncbi:MAG: amidohydrolase family protein [Desulfitobacteriaceae bacterium]
MLFFDCDTQIGRSYGTSNVGGKNIAASDLIQAMDQIGVSKAIVYHTLAREYHPTHGNEILKGALKGYENRLLGCWILLPHHTGEMDHPRQLVQKMLQENIHIARIFPSFHAGSHRFELTEWCIGEMLTELERAKIPLMIDFALFRRDQPPFRDIFNICKDHPNLPIILIGVQARNNRNLYPLMEKFQNLHIQTAGFFVHRGVEHFVNYFGSERLIFGSEFPIQRMGAARFHIERALISEEHKERIASGNLIRLLDSVKKGG